MVVPASFDVKESQSGDVFERAEVRRRRRVANLSPCMEVKCPSPENLDNCGCAGGFLPISVFWQ